MNLTFTFDANRLEGLVEEKMELAKLRVVYAMTGEVYDIVMKNFGPIGIDRPLPWAPLSNRAPYFYAQQVGRQFATLRVTGAMEQAVRHQISPDGGSVTLSDEDCRYATRHHFGDPEKNLPIRRVFPINLDGSITDYTRAAVLDAATKALEAELA